jgi:signal transduction histidine kinase
MAVLLPHGAFLKEDRLIFTPGTAEPLGVSPPEAVDLLLIKRVGPRSAGAPGPAHGLAARRPAGRPRISRGRIELQSESVDLVAVIGRAIQAADPLIRGRGHERVASLPPDHPAITGDATRLEQIAANLLNNAAKYTEPGGRIAVELRREGRELAPRIRDNGIGITSETLTRIFDPFFQVGQRVESSQGGSASG